jgi:hypothetical protein
MGLAERRTRSLAPSPAVGVAFAMLRIHPSRPTKSNSPRHGTINRKKPRREVSRGLVRYFATT